MPLLFYAERRDLRVLTQQSGGLLGACRKAQRNLDFMHNIVNQKKNIVKKVVKKFFLEYIVCCIIG